MLALASVKDESEVQADLEKIIKHELIYKIRSAKGERYLFKHALVRDAAYDAMLFSSRQQSHARVAQSLEIRMAEADFNPFNKDASLYSSQLAGHHEAAGNISKAIKLWCNCGQQAANIAAHSEACEQYSRAIRLLDKQQNSASLEKELNIRKQQGASLIAVYGWASTQVENNANLVLEISNLKNEALPITEYWMQFTNALTLHDTRQANKIMLSAKAIAVEPQQEFLFTLMQGMERFYSGDMDRANDYLGDTLLRYNTADPLLRESISCDAAIFVLVHNGWSKFLQGDNQQAHKFFIEAQQAANNNPFFEALALTFHCAICLFSEYDQFPVISKRCNDLAMSGGFSILEGVSHVFIGQLNIQRGQTEEGIKEMELGLKMQSALRHRLFACVYYAKLAQSYLDYKQDPDTAQHYLELGFEHANEQFGSFFKPELYHIQAQIYLTKGRRSSASQALRQGLDFALYLSPKQTGTNFFMQRLSALQNLQPQS